MIWYNHMSTEGDDGECCSGNKAHEPRNSTENCSDSGEREFLCERARAGDYMPGASERPPWVAKGSLSWTACEESSIANVILRSQAGSVTDCWSTTTVARDEEEGNGRSNRRTSHIERLRTEDSISYAVEKLAVPWGLELRIMSIEIRNINVLWESKCIRYY